MFAQIYLFAILCVTFSHSLGLFFSTPTAVTIVVIPYHSDVTNIPST